MCTNCGATFKRKTSATTILIVSTVIIALAATCFFLFQNTDDSQKQNQAINTDGKSMVIKNNPEIKNEIKNIPAIKTTDTPAITLADTLSHQTPIVADTVKPKPIIKPDSALSKKIDVAIFSADELKGYKVTCSYFEKKQKNDIIFVVANSTGYIKVNSHLHQLKRTHKSNDFVKFSDGFYETTVTIDGLSGSDKEWLAAATLSVKDVIQKTTARYKIYSTCIDL
jgi:hypothetical protein